MHRRLLALAASAVLVACAPEDADEVVGETADQLAGEGGFKDARAKLSEVRDDLASNTAHLRGILTADQTAQYSAAFWKLDRVKKASDDYAKKASSLAENLANDTATLAANTKVVKATECGSTRFGADAQVTKARDLYNSAKLLSTANVIGSGKKAPAYAVRDFYTYIAKRKDVRSCLSKSLDDLEKDLGANHAQMIVQLKLESPNASPFAVVKDALSPLVDVSSNVKNAANTLEKFAQTQDSALLEANGTSSSTKLAGGVIAVLSLGDVATDAAHGRFKAAAVKLLKGGSGDLAAVADAVSLLEGFVDSGRAQNLFTKVGTFSNLAGKIAGGVGVVTSAINLFNDLNKYEGDRLVHLSRIAADAAALQASIVAVAGLSSLLPVAGAIVLLTQTVLFIAEYWHKHEVSKRRNADTKATLRAIGFNGKVADAFADADSSNLRSLTQEKEYSLGLGPTDVQTLATFATTISNGMEAFFILPDNGRWYQSASEVKRVFGLDDKKTVAMLKTTAGSDAVNLRVAFDLCISNAAGVFASKQGFFNAANQCKNVGDADDRAALARLVAFLRAS